jgi:hypothetical protein
MGKAANPIALARLAMRSSDYLLANVRVLMNRCARKVDGLRPFKGGGRLVANRNEVIHGPSQMSWQGEIRRSSRLPVENSVRKSLSEGYWG